MQRSSAEVGSFGSFSYVSLSLSMLRILLSYWVLSRTTVQLPLSAGKMASDVSDFICLRVFVSSGFKLLAGGLAFANTPTIRVLALFLASWGARDLKMVFSTAATNWAVGTLLGAGAKFRPLLSTDSWAGVRGLEDRFTTHFFLLGGGCGRFFWERRRRSSNLRFWRNLQVSVCFLSVFWR